MSIRSRVNFLAATLVLGLCTCVRNRAPVPPDAPAGPALVRTGIEYSYLISAEDPDGDSISIRVAWEPGDTTGWMALVESGEQLRLVHSWAAAGTYDIRLQARDAAGLESDWSAGLNIECGDTTNNPPARPDPPEGATYTYVGIVQEMRAWASDPDGDSVSLQLDWGRDDTVAWTALIPGGQVVTYTHDWQTGGSQRVRVRARDSRGAVSNWSRSHRITISRTGTVKWRLPADPAPAACPAIGPGGVIYLNSTTSGLQAYDPALGTAKWTVTEPVLASPSVAANGNVYAAVGRGGSTSLVAYRSSGVVRWSVLLGSDVYSTPAIDASGNIYVGTQDGRLLAVDQNGNSLWERLVGPVWGPAAVGPDSALYVLRYDDSLVALRTDGAQRWALPVASDAYSALAVGADGTVYLPCWEGSNNWLLAVGPDGTERWRCGIGWASHAPVIGPDGMVYIGCFDGSLYAVSRRGELRWRYDAGSVISSSAAVTEEGTILFGCEDGMFYGLNSDGSLRLRSRIGAVMRDAPVTIGADGTIYVCADDDYLYALHGNTPLATGEWPKFQRDLSNSGRSGD